MNQPDQDMTDAAFEAQRRKGRLIMVAIVAVFVLPFFLVRFLPSPDELGKTNKGHFVQPHIAIETLGMKNADGTDFTVEQLTGRWTLLYVLPTPCESDCQLAREHALFAIRQVRYSLDRNIDRAQQLLVEMAAADSELNKLLEEKFSGMNRVQGEQNTLQENLLSRSGVSGPAGSIFLVSPDGWIFMAYPTFADENESIIGAKDIRYDLKKSIKGERKF